MKKLLLASVMAFVLMGSAHAATSKDMTFSTRVGWGIQFTMDIDATQAFAGVNGELNYDPAVFSNPRVYPYSGAYKFTALGNEIEPGKFRFVVYNNPTYAMTEGVPQVEFALDVVNDTALRGTQHFVTFDNALSALSTPEGVSFGVAAPDGLGEAVTFGTYTVNIEETAVADWSFYE